jgi:hypothetical protein
LREEREDETTYDAPADRDGNHVIAGVEREVLQERVQRLEKRLGEVDASDRIAENLYEFFSPHRAARLEAKASEEVPNEG